MILGQSSATAAAMAIDANIPVQKVDYAKLNERLLADQQILVWTGPGRKVMSNIQIKDLPGIVVDEDQAEFRGDWTHSTSARSLANGYRHDINDGKGAKKAIFRPEVKETGTYEIYLLYPALGNRATNTPVTIEPEGGEAKQVLVNQQKAGKNNETLLGTFELNASHALTITVSNEGTDGFVIVDGVQLIKK